MNKNITFAALLLAQLALNSGAAAAPFSVTPASAMQGTDVTVSLLDADTDNLEAATLQFFFDPAVVEVTAVTQGTLTQGFSLIYDLGTPGVVLASLAGLVGSNDLSGSILEIALHVLADAPLGDSVIAFECFQDGPLLCNGDYVVPRTEGTLTVTPVPIPAAAALLASALPLLLPRRRRAGA